MSLVTPNYSIPYLTPGDRMAQIPDVDKAQALRIESLLETANVPPGNPDLNDVLARLNVAEAKLTKTQGVMTFTNSSFEIYTSPGDTPTVYKNGNTCMFIGAFRCTVANLVTSVSNIVVGTLPLEYRPPQRISGVMQGSGTMTWFVQIMPNGEVIASRASQDHNNNLWMPFCLTYIL
ncbi:hypothetical protein [Glutamicibacter sp. AOP33-2CA-4]|uniref:hypothetical protein n=1 Tax=Glutamicibacter sp. AOP33-2CA-4 TaxID=3457690 RepID=UPI004034CC2C